MKTESKNKLYICPYSHLDLFWGGTMDECLSRGNYIIEKALDLMDQQEDYRFMIETVNFLDNYLECRPDDFERVKQYVLAERLFVGAMWSATYQNITDGELMIRNILYAKDYIRDKFGIDQDIVNIGDLPGYTPQYPALAKHCGINALIFTRCGPRQAPLFHWRALDGAECLTWFIRVNYPGFSHTDMHKGYSEINQEKMQLRLDQTFDDYECPAFAHLGSDLWSPSGEYIKNMKKINAARPELEMIPGTPKDFFDAVKSIENLPALSGDIPSAWPHVESSWPQLWPLVTPAAVALKNAELFYAVGRSMFNAAYPETEFVRLYKQLLDGADHNQNGQGGSQADAEKVGMIAGTRDAAMALTRKAMRTIVANIGSDDYCSAITVFNPLPWVRKEYVESRIAFYGEVKPAEMVFEQSDLTKTIRDDLHLCNADGNEVIFDVLDERGNISRGMTVGFMAEVPPCGYATYYFAKGKAAAEEPVCTVSRENPPTHNPCRAGEKIIYETSVLKLEIDEVTGAAALYHKQSDSYICKDIHIAGVEERGGDYIFNTNTTGREFPLIPEKIELIRNTPLEAVIEIAGLVGDIKVVQKLIMHKDSDKLRIVNEIDWKYGCLLRLQQVFGTAGEVKYDVPYGQVKYPETMPGSGPMAGADEVDHGFWSRTRLVNNRLTVKDGTNAFSIAMSNRLVEIEPDKLRCYMVRGAKYCSAINYGAEENNVISHPPQGSYTATYTISPGTGVDTGSELQTPLIPMPKLDNSSTGSLPLTQSFCRCGGLGISSIYWSETDLSIIGRFCNMSDQTQKVELAVMGSKPRQEVTADGRFVCEITASEIEFKPYQLRTFKF